MRSPIEEIPRGVRGHTLGGDSFFYSSFFLQTIIVCDF